MDIKLLMLWFSVVSAILVLAGVVFAFFGLDILPVSKNVLLQWESAIYGAIMIGWGQPFSLPEDLHFEGMTRSL